MEINIYRKKLYNAVLYFAKNTKFPNLTNILKLLYFFDFTHFKQTGYPSIGLEYFTFPRGPVPRSFWLEVKDGNVPDDFREKLAIYTKKDEYDPSQKELIFKALQNPELDIFTQRELEILENIAFIYKDIQAWQTSEVTHLKNAPWEQTMKKMGLNHKIDYMLALDKDSEINEEEAKESLKEYFEIIRNFMLETTK